MYTVKLIDNFGNISCIRTAEDESEMREITREFALEIDAGEKIVVE